MKVTVTTTSDHIFTLEVGDDMELENFKALCEIESNIPANLMRLTSDGKQLTNDKLTLNQLGITDNSLLLIEKISVRQSNPAQTQPKSAFNLDFGSIQVPQPSGSRSSSQENKMNNPAFVRQMLLNSPDQLSVLKINNPPLAEALIKSEEEFEKVFRHQQNERIEQEKLKLKMLLADPFDIEAQSLIANEIAREQIEKNMETAMEYHPESFGTVTMLYIDCKVNGHPVKAFIDSGAQSTIMSSSCAERCHITRLIDKRWSGIAQGVGTQKIIGRIHLCQLQIVNDFLPSSFTILNQPMDMLLGLDMLRRHQCCIDLKANYLLIGTTGTKTRFLDEAELPEFAKHRNTTNLNEMTDEQLDPELDEAIQNSIKEAQK